MSLTVAASFSKFEKAFENAVREAVMGYPSHVGSDPISRRAHLENFGFPPVVVREVLRMNENRPPSLEEWRVSAKPTRLIAALHSGSWFRHGECPSVAETRQSGKQGCKLGKTIFNVLHAEALERLQNKLLDEGFVARVVFPSQPVDPENVDTVSVVPIIDIVYVDDLTMLIVAASPASTQHALDTLLISLFQLFTPLGLVINWNPGKIEVMLRFRGSGSVAEYEMLRSEHGAASNSRVSVASSSQRGSGLSQLSVCSCPMHRSGSTKACATAAQLARIIRLHQAMRRQGRGSRGRQRLRRPPSRKRLEDVRFPPVQRLLSRALQ